MAEYESRKKRSMLERKMLVLALCVLICVPSTKGIPIKFGDESLNSWQFALGANSKELLFDFCKYNGTSGGMQCKNFPMPASIDFEKRCGCTIQHNETNDGSLSLDLGCKSDLSYCPKELTLTYRQGSYARAPDPDPDVATSGLNGWLLAAFIISTAFNVLLVITIILACLINEKVFPSFKEKWNKSISYP